jgi:asparagine synthase (glutamine-hydrolysing)
LAIFAVNKLILSNLDPHIPKGGFFVAKSSSNLADLEHRLKDNGAQTLTLQDQALVFAAWEQFPGQGLWSDKNAAVGYDVDLTNEAQLQGLVDIHCECSNPGQLLWVLYRKFGLDLLDRLRGAFGFALWDGEKDTLLVATDAFGVRPVVYSQKSGKLVAASRIRHILLDHDLSREIDPEAIYHYLFFQAICSPVSIYKDIRKLEPGKALYFENGSLKELVHYDIRYQPDMSLGESHWVKTIPLEIEKAVKPYVQSVLTKQDTTNWTTPTSLPVILALNKTITM